MAAASVWVMALVLIFAEGAMLAGLGVTDWAVQMGLVLTCYLGLRREFHGSAWVMAGILLPLEWTAGGMGVYALGAVIIFFLLRVLARQLEARWSIWKTCFCGAAILVHHLFMALYWLMVAPDSPILSAVLATMIPATLLSAAVALPTGWMLAKIETQLAPREAGQGLGL